MPEHPNVNTPKVGTMKLAWAQTLSILGRSLTGLGESLRARSHRITGQVIGSSPDDDDDTRAEKLHHYLDRGELHDR